MFPNKNVKSQGLTYNQIDKTPTFAATVPEPILLSENLYHSAKKMADERFKTSAYKNTRDWWRLVCQAIDQEYYQFIGSFKSATTESEKQIWLNILRATINDIHQDAIANNKGHQTVVMSKNKIKRNILKACP
jgi:hypothetical protein